VTSLHTRLRRDHPWIVFIILLISLLLRWILIIRGGQYYISDETRYEVSRDAARFLLQGQLGEALRQFTISPEHLGFKVVGIIPALMEQLAGTSLVLPAMFFSLFSVLNLYLIFLLAQRSSSSPNVPLYALFFAASCLALLYYSRHLFPYDMAMLFGLLALYTALARNQSNRTSLACGGLSFLCFITYNGYWPLAGFAMLINVLGNDRKINEILKKTVFTAAGFVAPLVLLIIVMLGSGTDMLAAYRLFATSITQGSFEEGWSLPFEYFWHTEHIGILILGLFAVYAIFGNSKDKQQYVTLWAGGAIFIYVCLLIPSVFLHWFVVYARLARQMLPFLVLLSAQGLALMEERKLVSHPITVTLLALLFLQAAWNFGISYQLHYPRQFSERLKAQFPTFDFSSKRMAYGAPAVCQSKGYVIENVKYFLSAPETTQQVKGEVLWEVQHPVNFLPYQYEGYTPEQRQGFREQQLKMRFYRVDGKFASASNPDWITIKNCAVRGD
jgi:hypothetical protein